MQDRPAPATPPDAIQNAPTPGPLGDSFLAAKPYPGQVTAPAPPAPPPPAAPPRRRIFGRVVLPLLIFVAAIGILAWVTQYLPNRSPPNQPDADGGGPKVAMKVLKFWTQIAVWEPQNGKAAQPQEDNRLKAQKTPPYAAEYEVASELRQDDGHYDFVFENANDEPVALGVANRGCKCAKISACLLQGSDWERYQKFQNSADPVTRSRKSPEDGFPWKPLIETDHKGLLVPPRAHGVLRVFWSGQGRRAPEQLLLQPELWVSPPGRYEARGTGKLAVPVAYVNPVVFDPERVDIGALGPQTPSLSAVFHCRSATRDLQVRVREDDPCFVLKATPLNEQECRKLSEGLRERGTLTHVRSAFRVEVTVYEEKGGKLLDLGSFVRPARIEIKGNNEVLHPMVPMIRGRVLGDVKVGALEEERGINLKYFKGPQGTTVKTTLWAKPGLQLAYDGFGPPILKLKVDVRRQKKEDINGWAAWEVRVTVPPGLDPGPLPEDSAILFRAGEGKTARKVRIPLIGSVGRG